MPRDGSGNYTLPAGNPVISGTVITPTWANPTMSDIGVEITDSLSRSGKGGMLVAFKNVDGTIGDPGMTWTNEPTSGFSRTDTNVMNASIGGTQSTRWVFGDLGFEIWDGTTWVKPLVASSSPIIFTGDLTIENVQPKLRFNETDVTTDQGNWLFRCQGGQFGLHTATDAAPGTIVNPAWFCERTGTVVDSVNFPSLNIHTASIRMDGGAIILKNNLNISGTPFSDIGTVRILRLNASDIWEIGQASSAVLGMEYDSGNADSSHVFEANNVEVARFNATGWTIPNSTGIKGRNAADDGDVQLVSLSAGDTPTFGTSSNDSQLQAPTNINIRVAFGTTCDFVTSALGGLLITDRPRITIKKAGYRNPTRGLVSASRVITQDDEGRVLVQNGGSVGLTMDALEQYTRFTWISASGTGFLNEGSGATIQNFTGSAREDGNVVTPFASVWECWQPLSNLWYVWEVT